MTFAKKPLGFDRPVTLLLVFLEFLPSLKRLLGTPVYCLFLCGSILRFNAIIGQITFTPKYMEQQFGLSTARANFLVGNKIK